MPEAERYCQAHIQIVEIVTKVKTNLSNLNESNGKVWKKLDELSTTVNDAINSRPTWAVAWVITTLTSLVVGGASATVAIMFLR